MIQHAKPLKTILNNLATMKDVVAGWGIPSSKREPFDHLAEFLSEDISDLSEHMVDPQDQEILREGFEMASKIYKGEREDNKYNRSVVRRGLTVVRKLKKRT